MNKFKFDSITLTKKHNFSMDPYFQKINFDDLVDLVLIDFTSALFDQ